MKHGIRPWPLEKSQEINKRRGIFIPDPRVVKLGDNKRLEYQL